METAATSPQKEDSVLTSAGLLLIALLLLVISNGRWIVPAATWIAPVLLVRYLRQQRGVGTVGALLVVIVAFAISWKGLIPFPPQVFALFAVTYGSVLFVPYLLDRWGSRRVRGFASTLFLPTAWVCVEFLSSRFPQAATWGNLGYTQVDNLPLMQVVSVTGLWGVSFVIMWSASTINWIWERRSSPRSVRLGVGVLAGTIVGLTLAGGLRLASARQADAPTMKVAGVSVAWRGAKRAFETLRAPLAPVEMNELRDAMRTVRDSLFLLSGREADRGAKIVVWSELNGFVFADDLPHVLETASELARAKRFTLVMALAVFTPGRQVMENVMTFVDSTGKVGQTYHKSRPVPGDPETGGTGILPTMQLHKSVIGGAICYDADFSSMINQLGRRGTDILLVPASDWQAIDPLHSRMAIVRGIENGFSVIRPTHSGLSLASDPFGRIIASVDYFATQPHVIVADLPERGILTLYAQIGDVFPWLCVMTLLLLIAIAVLRPYDKSVTAGRLAT